ncbi:MAG: class I SAM-dependent methyltransferase [bacterium]
MESTFKQSMENDEKEKIESDNMEQSAIKQDIETAQRAATEGGKKLEALYGGFFGSEKNCELFATLVPEGFFNKDSLNGQITIVDAGSSEGVLGDYIRNRAVENGLEAQLVMVDTNGPALNLSPVKAEKIVGNLLENPLKDELADIIILRSVLQYVGYDDQKKLLQGLYKNLKPNGILISQFCSFDTTEQAKAMNNLFSCAKRKTSFHGKIDGLELHKSVFDEIEEVIEGPTLYETFDEFFVDRVKAPAEQKELAKNYIQQHLTELGRALTSTVEPYSWQLPYTIARCKKTSGEEKEKSNF